MLGEPFGDAVGVVAFDHSGGIVESRSVTYKVLFIGDLFFIKQIITGNIIQPFAAAVVADDPGPLGKFIGAE